jgi:inosine-uridine nucleoside N-ribohydrolase
MFGILFVLMLSGCHSTQSQVPTSASDNDAEILSPTIPPYPVDKPHPVLFDDDGSPDGTAALFFLLSHQRVSVKAVNISYGEAYPDIYIQHIARVLDDSRIMDIPLGAGQNAPLAGANAFPENVRQDSNNFWGLPLPNAEKTYPTQDAAELMVTVIKQSPEPVTLFISGSGTNLAQALRLDPVIEYNIAAVYIMGGAVYVPGNIQGLLPESENLVAEWNIYADPQAAKEIFETGLHLFLVPLDATNQVMIDKRNTRQWRKGSPVGVFAADIYDMLFQNWGTDRTGVWDLMTAAIMVKPELCEFQPLYLQVVTEEGKTNGQTVVIQDVQPNIQVCLKPDVKQIRQTFDQMFSSGWLP